MRPIMVTMLPHMRSVSRTSGVITSVFAPGEKTAPKSKLAGKTPTTVTGVLFRSIVLPTMAGSASNCRCQYG